MNLKELKEIIAIFEAADISELDLEREGIKIKLKKGMPPEFSVLPGASLGEPGKIPSLAKAKDEPSETGLIEVTSPIIGTFYRASSPNAKPFVEEGEEVEAGQVLCIIEAMKLMNEIKAESKGRIVEILAENGHPVEFGQALFKIKT